MMMMMESGLAVKVDSQNVVWMLQNVTRKNFSLFKMDQGSFIIEIGRYTECHSSRHKATDSFLLQWIDYYELRRWGLCNCFYRKCWVWVLNLVFFMWCSVEWKELSGRCYLNWLNVMEFIWICKDISFFMVNKWQLQKVFTKI